MTNINRHGRLVRKDRNVCLGGTAYWPGPEKLPQLQDLKFPKAVLHSLFHDPLYYILRYLASIRINLIITALNKFLLNDLKRY